MDGWRHTGLLTLRAMGQRSCSIKDEDELVQIIGKYRMTSELHWVDFKGGIDNQTKTSIVKNDSYSSDSLDEYCNESTPLDTEKSKSSSDENSEFDMSNEKSLSRSSSVNTSVQDSNSITSHYSLEIVEETERLQTESITEAVDIRISPCNSTIMSFDCSDNFYSEFALVAKVDVQISDANHNEETKMESRNHCKNRGELNPLEEHQNKTNVPDVETMNISEDNSINGDNIQYVNNIRDQNLSSNEKISNSKNCDSCPQGVSEYYASKIEVTNTEKRMSSSIEKKIAEEIKELKQREEDLRVMRKKVAKEMSEKSLVKDSLNVMPTVFPKAEIKMPNVSNCDEKSIPKKVTKIENASTNIKNSYVKACVFAVKRKDFAIKVENAEIMIKKSSAIDLRESPVEQEIRIAKEREGELKREREQALNYKFETDSFSSEISANETDVDSALSICSDSSFDSNNKLALLFPRTGSLEMNKKNDGMSVDSSSAGSMCSLDSVSQREKLNSGTPLSGGSYNGSIFSPDSGIGKPFKSHKISKNIDMERFISSKGKEIKFKSDMMEPTSYYELRPPQVKKGEEMTCKRFITAASKIRKELMEMQQREEQLKKERENLLEEWKNPDNKDVKESSAFQKTSENMNLFDSAEGKIKDNVTKQDNSVNHTRRRSILIDEWEERIQKSTLQA